MITLPWGTIVGIIVAVAVCVFIYFEEVVWPRKREARVNECIETAYHCGWPSTQVQRLLAEANIYEDLDDIEARLREYHDSITD